jgi:hypothetical protein
VQCSKIFGGWAGVRRAASGERGRGLRPVRA